MLDAYARDSLETQLLGRLVARFAVNELIAATNKERITEAEQATRKRGPRRPRRQ